ncbi:MAG: heme oxygenase HmuO [Phormidesmis priestleyi Ana]|uniref:Heme oxygenase HmuO n=1 Tax=Phormidesmis priestleyi Ana TaxID=1666911 RepID=A0A0P8BLY3_9CYAN|nr:MAG: heme oxygenase HmuO [Phormidesmis priestleyi Ana]
MCAPTSMCPPLALCLREGTQQSHSLAENTVLMKCLRNGLISAEPLRQWMASLYFVYSALELEMYNHADHPVIGRIYFPRLERTLQLENDLAFYYGDNWRRQIQPSRKTIRYVMRLHAIANDQPALLAAHAYVRYMGDLSGGQGLRAKIRSALKLPEGLGTAFYEFEGLPTAETRRAFKGVYRDALNQLPVDTQLATQLIEEANLAFKLNCDVMHELASQVKATVSEATWELITHENLPGSTAHLPPPIELVSA